MFHCPECGAKTVCVQGTQIQGHCTNRWYIFQRLTVIVVTGTVSGPLATIFAHEQLPNWSLLAHMAIGCGIGSMEPQAALVRARKVRKMTMLAPDDANE